MRTTLTRALRTILSGITVTIAMAGLAAPTGAAPPKSTSGALAGPVANDDGPAYLTFAWGRSLWATGCNPKFPIAAGVRTLEQTAKDLQAAGLTGVGGVVVDRTTTKRTCARGVTDSTWADLGRLRDRYGWSFVSQSKSYIRMPQLSTDADRLAQTGGSLGPLRSHGHSQAWGAFFYPDDEQDLPAQTMVAKYFAFGRRYTLTPAVNTQAAATTFPYSMITYTPLGGRCANEALPCHNITVRNSRITSSPDDIVTALNPAPGTWSVIQMFRLVQGKFGTLGQPNAWDCTSPNWQDRWTSVPENYCRNTLLSALAQRDTSVLNVTPAQMAQTWGRLPG